MFRLAERPALMPGATLLGNTDGPVVDCGELPAGGRIYVGRTELRGIVAAWRQKSDYEFVDRADFDAAIRRAEQAESERDEARAALESVRGMVAAA